MILDPCLRQFGKILFSLAASGLVIFCPTSLADAHISARTVEITARHTHDASAFTQGLLYYNGFLYESTGLYGQSSLRRIAIKSGRIQAYRSLPDTLFGEGLARVGDRLFQLTWKAGVALVYSIDDLGLVDRRHYRGQGWGLTWDGEYLVMSDGSAILRFLDPDSFAVDRKITVTFRGQSVDNLNELEYICGAIWANIRYSDTIIRIDPTSGTVTGRLDASPVRQALPSPENAGVLNGIAWDRNNRRLFITGKNWPFVFQIRMPWPCEQPPKDVG